LHFVCGALLAYDAAAGRSPFLGLDIERVFSAVQLLAERNALEVSPFVASWHPAVDALDASPPTSAVAFDRQFGTALTAPDSFGGVESLIVDLIDSRVGTGSSGEIYRRLADEMVSELRSLVATEPKEVGYLLPLVREGIKDGGLTVATLNYDVSVEQAAALAGADCTTGILGWIESGRWHWPEDAIRLIKLHGSIDWIWEATEHRAGQLPYRALRIADDPGQTNGAPALVFGHRGKLRAEGPFLGLFSELESQMSKADRLIVIGYSFRDEHVNELIRRWTYEDITRTICVVDPMWPDYLPPSRGDFRVILERHLQPPPSEDPPAFPNRLEIRREPCSKAVDALFADA
jgi:SIR2-like domain